MDLLSEDPNIKRWLDEFCVKGNATGNYLRSMHEYTEYTGRSPSELADEAKAGIERGLLIDRRTNLSLMGFQAYLRDKGFSPFTTAGSNNSVKK